LVFFFFFFLKQKRLVSADQGLLDYNIDLVKLRTRSQMGLSTRVTSIFFSGGLFIYDVPVLEKWGRAYKVC